MRHAQQSSNSFLAFMSGAAFGAASALLLAPQSGRRTRDHLRGYVESGRQRSEQFQLAMQAASEAARQAFLDAMRQEEARIEPAPARSEEAYAEEGNAGGHPTG